MDACSTSSITQKGRRGGAAAGVHMCRLLKFCANVYPMQTARIWAGRIFTSINRWLNIALNKGRVNGSEPTGTSGRCVRRSRPHLRRIDKPIDRRCPDVAPASNESNNTKTHERTRGIRGPGMSECPRYIGCWSDLISDAGVVHLQSTLLSYLLPHFICNTERESNKKVAIKNQTTKHEKLSSNVNIGRPITRDILLIPTRSRTPSWPEG